VRCFGLEERNDDPRQYKNQPSGSIQSSVQGPHLETTEELDEREPLSIEAKVFIARCATASTLFQSAALSAERPFDVEIFLADPHNSGYSEVRDLINLSYKVQRMCRRAKLATAIRCNVSEWKYIGDWETLKRWLFGTKGRQVVRTSTGSTKRCRTEGGLVGGRGSCRCVKGGGVCSA
jgi:hypothetical protein